LIIAGFWLAEFLMAFASSQHLQDGGVSYVFRQRSMWTARSWGRGIVPAVPP